MKEAKTGLVADNFKVLVDGKEVTPTAISGETNGEIYTITIPSLEGKAGRVSVNGTEATFDFSFPKVEGVTALNASELLVTFNKDVDVPTAQNKANYELKINDKKVETEDILDISASGKTAKILLDFDVAFQSGDKYIIQTNDGIKTTEGKLFDKFVSDEKTFNGSLAPSLKSIKVDANGLLVEFDRPVNSYDDTEDVTLIKIDGVAIASKDLKPVFAKDKAPDILGKAGQYTYRVTLTDAELKAASAVGTHEVVIYDVKDTASEYAKVASVLNGEYTITDEVTAPQVTGIEALNANKFFVYTNTPVTLDANTKLKVEKGNHEFKLDDSKFDGNVSTEDTLVDAVPGYHPVNKKPGIYVVVTDDVKGDDENPLYKNGETSVTLKVTLENYTANGLIGKKAEQTVTLNRNNTKPAVQETAINGNNLEVTFTNALASLDGNALTGLTADDVVIRDKDGIVKSPSEAISVTGSKVTIPLTSTDDGPYTVEFKAGKFKNLEVSDSVESYLVNTLKNDKLVATVAAKDNNFKYLEFDLAAGANLVANDNNQITFNYPVEMSDSARSVANYTLDGKALPAGSTVDFVGDKKTVRITLPTGTLKASTKYKLGIKTDVTTAAGTHIVGSLQTKAPAEAIIELKDNVAPELKSALFLIGDETVKPSTETDLIEVTFNEKLAAIVDDATLQNDFRVVINGSTVGVAAVTDGTSGDDKLVIKLKQKVNVNQAATISIIPEEQQTGTLEQKEIVIKDVAGNKANTSKTINVSGSKYDSTVALQPEIDAAYKELEKITSEAIEAGLSESDNVIDIAQSLVAKGYTVTIESSENSAIKTDGAVTRGDAPTKGDVVFVVTKKDVVSVWKKLSITVPAVPATEPSPEP
ncbi:hypothetical protein NST61_18205 [Caldifermentibacillus hisashii]|uniref:hypothetical protein n=1 Tax=Caldifermentibacillus hisashii TaxID=996558 RepID=UPI0034D42284